MIKVFYGSKIDAVNWKIYADNVGKDLYFFPISTTPGDVADKLCQFSLFDLTKSTSNEKINVVDIDDWKLTDKGVQSIIRELHSIESTVIFALESSTCKNKLFTELKLETTKCNSVSRKSKEQMVDYFLKENQLKIDSEAKQILVDMLPDKIDFIKNEIQKLKLSCIGKLTSNDIKTIVFNTGDATIFNVIESWLNGNMNQTLERINDLLAANYLVTDIVPIFAYTLVQLKLYLQAKLANWSSADITAKQGLAFWQQNKYANLRPYDKTLDKVNVMLSKLYNFDINIKKQKNIPYSQLIKILFE